MHPSADIALALRTALPRELHYLAEPLARYIEAATALSVLAVDQTAVADISHALAALQNVETPSPSGAFTVGSGSQINELVVRDVAGRDILNLTINVPGLPSSTNQPNHKLDEWQLQLLRKIAARPNQDLLLDLDVLAQQTSLTVEEVDDELRLLEELRLLKMQWFVGAVTGKLTPAARKLLRMLDQDASTRPN